MFVKKVLFKILGLEKYLQFVSKMFFASFFSGRLKKDPSYDCHYYTTNFVKEGDTVIDIGANLGYYAIIFSKIVKSKGEVLAVEPVENFRNVLEKNIRKYTKDNNVTVFPYGLGKDHDKKVPMGMSVENGVFRHGLTKVIKAEDAKDYAMTREVYIKNPQILFKDLEKLDYIKCDIEGFEIHVMPEMMPLIRKFRPIVQIEIGPIANRKAIFELFEKEKYDVFYLLNKKLQPLEKIDIEYELDYYLIPRK